MSLRYVSRYHVKDSARHVILGTQQFKPNEFASQINLSMENAWGILRCVIDICRKLDEGKYLILKDPNKVSRQFLSTLCAARILKNSVPKVEAVIDNVCFCFSLVNSK